MNQSSFTSSFMIYILFLCLNFQLNIVCAEKIDNKVYDIAVFGSPTSGPLIEGAIGAIQKGYRHRFYCHSSGPNPGFIGAQTSTKLSSIKEQPGVFPAPLMGSDSLQFTFALTASHDPVIPVIVKPDGTILKGYPMTYEHAPQVLSIPYPAQTGIYNFFVLNQNINFEKNSSPSENPWINVNVITNHQSRKSQNFSIKTFNAQVESPEFICAEYIY
ncbi:MAG: hypothetical protein Q8K60_07940 [Parachlamydiaceae bacterium]|nr:hypothetical protein [Parachlamydiaceae bacterium]